MKYLLTLLAIFYAFFIVAQPKNLDLSIASLNAELIEGAESVVRYYDYNYVADSDRTSTVSVFKAVTILSDESNDNRIVVYYDDEVKLSHFKASIYDAFGNKVRDAKKSEIEDILVISGGQFYMDNRVQTVVLDHTTYPYTIVYEYDLKQRDFGAMGFPQWSPSGFNQSCQSARLTASIPLDNELLFDSFGLPDPTVSVDEKSTTFTWKVKDLPAIRDEPYAPVRARTLPNVKTQLKNFRIDEYSGTFESWDGYGKFMNQLLAGRDELPAPLKTEITELTANATTDAEKIDLLYQFMQDRVRYVGIQLGIGGWQPFSAEYVETNRYGDCKALSNYMGSMLKEVGVESYPVLVNRGRPRYELPESFPTTTSNHMLLHVPGHDMYLECTSNYAPTGYLGEGKEDRNVLLITPEGGKLVKTPPLEPTDHGHLRRQDITVKADGTAQLTINTHYFGAEQEILRQLTNALTPEKQKEWLHSNGYLPDLGGKQYDFKVAKRVPDATLLYQTELPRYARKMGKRLFVPLNKFFAYDDLPVAITDRKLPVVLNESRFFVDTIQITLPPTFKVESSGKENIDIEHAAGEYHSNMQVVNNQLTWTRTLKLFPVNLPAEEYTSYRDFFIQVSKADKRQLVLKVGATR